MFCELIIFNNLDHCMDTNIHQASVVQTMDRAIRRINHYPVDKSKSIALSNG